MNDQNFKQYILPLAAGGTIIFLGYKIGQKLGIIDDDKDQQNNTLLSPESPLYPDYFIKQGAGARLLTTASAEYFTKLLWDAHSWYNDNEEKIYSVFQSMKAKSQVSYLAYYFAKTKKESLAFWLRNFLSDKELNNIYQIINVLPNK